MSAKAIAGIRIALRMRAALFAAIVVTLALAMGTSAHAATIMINSLADTGAPGICVLRDAITAANTMTATNGCVAGDGTDTIDFSVTGTILLASTLPQVTDTQLTINGPASRWSSIKIDGGNKVQVMQVASGTMLNINKLTIAHGVTTADGGGIDNNGTLSVANSTFSNNVANVSAESSGGGSIYNTGTLTVTNSTFSDNVASVPIGSGGGGGIYNIGRLTVTNSTFSDNVANVSGESGGGGIYNIGTLSVTSSTFSDNSVVTVEGNVGGGGIDNYNEGTLTVINSTFTGNRASNDGFGGGIQNTGRSLTVINSTFSNNSAGLAGGGIANLFGTLTVTSSTFSGNSGAIDSFNATTTRLKSTILAANGDNCTNYGGGTVTDAGYNISDDSSCGFSANGSRNNTNPMLDPAGLRNNGGPTQTIALLSGSPAIDAIPLPECTDQSSLPNPIITDQRLFPRPDAGEHRCDIGAYEFADTPFVAFSRFHGHLTIRANQTVFDLGGRFKLGTGGNIDPTVQPVAFSVGSYAVRLPVGSFVNYNSGYVYQKRVNGIFLWVFIKFSGTSDTYILRAYRRGGTVPDTGSPVPVTLTIGDNSGSAQMKATFD